MDRAPPAGLVDDMRIMYIGGKLLTHEDDSVAIIHICTSIDNVILHERVSGRT